MEPGGSMSYLQGPQQFLSWAKLIQFFVLIYNALRFILLLSFHLHLGLPKGLFPVGLPVKILNEPLSSLIQATWPAHLNLLYLITLSLLGERYKLWSSSLWSLLHSPLSSILGPNISVCNALVKWRLLILSGTMEVLECIRWIVILN